MSTYLQKIMIDPEQLIEQSLKAGAEAAEVYISSSISHPVSFEANHLKQIESIDAAGIGLRIWKDGRMGLATAYGAVEPTAIVAQAIALSDLQEPEAVLLRSATVADYPRLCGQEMEVAVMIERGQAAIAQILHQYPEAICAVDWDCSRETMRIVNSEGLDCGYTDISITGSLSAELTRGDDFLNVWYAQADRHDFPIENLVQKVCQYLQWANKNVSWRSPQKVPVLFTAKAADLFWGVVAMAMNGRQMQQKTTPWLDKLGKSVISELFDVVQDPSLGIYGAPFDDEGTPTQAVKWIAQGKLQGFYGDMRTCRDLGLATTGNGFRGDLGNYPSPGLFNLAIAAQQTTQGDILQLAALLKNGLIVDQILGDDVDLSGDFSINVDLGYKIHNGEIVGRVKDTMVTGNIYQGLNQVMAVSSDRHWQGSLFVPAMIIDGLSVTSL